jgi:hypothetical protein
MDYNVQNSYVADYAFNVGPLLGRVVWEEKRYNLLPMQCRTSSYTSAYFYVKTIGCAFFHCTYIYSLG